MDLSSGIEVMLKPLQLLSANGPVQFAWYLHRLMTHDVSSDPRLHPFDGGSWNKLIPPHKMHEIRFAFIVLFSGW
jgi:hypothetical protein